MPRDYNAPAQTAILQSMPGSVPHLAAKSGFHRATVERQLRKLRADGKTRIVGWARPNGSGPFIAIHGRGSGPDAPCTLQPLTDAEDWALKVERIGRPTLRLQERDRNWRLKARRGQVRDPLVAALFGR